MQAKIAFGLGTYDPVEEAIFLVSETLGLPANGVDPFLPTKITPAHRARVLALIDKRIRLRMPAAYLLKSAYLQGLRFYIDRRVIVPRSYLAELICGDLFKHNALVDPKSVKKVLELCTGSGCLAILACRVFPNAHVDAVDISDRALQVAEINVSRHSLKDRITLLKGDLFEPVGGETYDIILANPPYVATKTIAKLPQEFAREPRLALDGGVDGLDIVRRILARAPAHLARKGGLLCEVGRGGPILEKDYPDLSFLWLDTEQSEGEVFWLTEAALRSR